MHMVWNHKKLPDFLKPKKQEINPAILALENLRRENDTNRYFRHVKSTSY